jgi:hypothetical protein
MRRSVLTSLVLAPFLAALLIGCGDARKVEEPTAKVPLPTPAEQPKASAVAE